MANLLKTFIIPEECQEISYNTDSPYPNPYSDGTVLGYKTVEVAVYDNHFEEKHIFYRDGEEKGEFSGSFEYKQFGPLALEQIQRNVNGSKYVQSSSPLMYALFYDCYYEELKMTIRQILLSVQNNEKSYQLIKEIKACIDSAICGRSEIIKEELYEESLEKTKEEKEKRDLEDKLECYFGVRSLVELKHRLSTKDYLSGYLKINDVDYSIVFCGDKYYLLLNNHLSVESLIVAADTEATVAERKALEAEDLNFNSEKVKLRSFIEEIEKRIFSLNTIGGAVLEPVEAVTFKKRTSALGLAIYEDIFGTAAAVGKMIHENSAQNKGIAFYNLSFMMNNNFYKGLVEVYLSANASEKGNITRIVSYINNQVSQKGHDAISTKKNEIIEQLKDLKDLLDSEAITQEEFDALKKQLLQN